MVAGLLVMEAGMLPIWRKASTVEAEKTYEDTLRVILMLCCEFVSRMQGLRSVGSPVRRNKGYILRCVGVRGMAV